VLDEAVLLVVVPLLVDVLEVEESLAGGGGGMPMRAIKISDGRLVDIIDGMVAV
jgi:hypothetical protein